tara:strand:- start:467 stop:673 length:207 start_codon:yes stop_codon:yes gene_type:complete
MAMDEAKRAELEEMLAKAKEMDGDFWGVLKDNMIRDLKKDLAGNARGGKIKKSYAKGGGVRKPRMGVD